MYRDKDWVLPSAIHHFADLNYGRQDRASIGDPAKELPHAFREPHEERGKGKPLGWDITKGVVVAHLFSDTPKDAYTVARACQERVVRLAQLQAKDPAAALIYAAVYFEKGEPIVPTYLGITCNRRAFAFPWIVGQWLDADRTRKVSDFTIPVSAVPFVSWEDTFTHTLRENNLQGRKPYSPIGLLHILQRLVRQGYGEQRACQSAGILKRGAQQKCYRLVLADGLFAETNLIGRLSLDPVAYLIGEKPDQTIEYRENGYIPYGPIDWTAIATLMGQRKKSGEAYHPDLLPASGGVATTAEVEAYIKAMMTGSKPESVNMASVKAWSVQFAPSPITARVGEILGAIVAGNRGYFAELLTPPAVAPPAVAPPVVAPPAKVKRTH